MEKQNNEVRKDKFTWEEGDIEIIYPDDPRYEEAIKSNTEDEQEEKSK